MWRLTYPSVSFPHLGLATKLPLHMIIVASHVHFIGFYGPCVTCRRELNFFWTFTPISISWGILFFNSNVYSSLEEAGTAVDHTRVIDTLAANFQGSVWPFHLGTLVDSKVISVIWAILALQFILLILLGLSSALSRWWQTQIFDWTLVALLTSLDESNVTSTLTSLNRLTI